MQKTRKEEKTQWLVGVKSCRVDNQIRSAMIAELGQGM